MEKTIEVLRKIVETTNNKEQWVIWNALAQKYKTTINQLISTGQTEKLKDTLSELEQHDVVFLEVFRAPNNPFLNVLKSNNQELFKLVFESLQKNANICFIDLNLKRTSSFNFMDLFVRYHKIDWLEYVFLNINETPLNKSKFSKTINTSLKLFEKISKTEIFTKTQYYKTGIILFLNSSLSHICIDTFKKIDLQALKKYLSITEKKLSKEYGSLKNYGYKFDFEKDKIEKYQYLYKKNLLNFDVAFNTLFLDNVKNDPTLGEKYLDFICEDLPKKENFFSFFKNIFQNKKTKDIDLVYESLVHFNLNALKILYNRGFKFKLSHLELLTNLNTTFYSNEWSGCLNFMLSVLKTSKKSTVLLNLLSNFNTNIHDFENIQPTLKIICETIPEKKLHKKIKQLKKQNKTTTFYHSLPLEGKNYLDSFTQHGILHKIMEDKSNIVQKKKVLL